MNLQEARSVEKAYLAMMQFQEGDIGFPYPSPNGLFILSFFLCQVTPLVLRQARASLGLEFISQSLSFVLYQILQAHPIWLYFTCPVDASLHDVQASFEVSELMRLEFTCSRTGH